MTRHGFKEEIVHTGLLATAGRLWAVLICVSLWCGSVQAAPLVIPIRSHVSVEGEQVFLGDIMNLEGDRIPEAAADLARIVVGRAPLPGQERTLDKDYLEIRLRQQGFNPEQFVLKGADRIQVTRSSVQVSPEQIDKIAIDYIYSKAPWDKNRIHVKSVRQNHTAALPEGKVSYEVEISKNEDFMGAIPLAVVFKVDGGYEKKIWVTVDLEVLGDVVVTRNAIRRFQTITEDDLEVRQMDLASLGSDTLKSIDAAVGQRARRALGANTILRNDHLERPYRVKPGDVVTLVAESQGLRVTGLGLVKEKGREGETVRVSNLDSNKDVYGQVVDSSTVRIEF